MAMHSATRGGPTSEINITPLVDVVLVLLIIFMVVTPVLRAGFETSVPPASKTTSTQPTGDLVVRLDADGALFINREPVTPGTFATRLQHILREHGSRPTFVSAAGTVPYQRVVSLMALCREAGAANLAVVVNELPAR